MSLKENGWFKKSLEGYAFVAPAVLVIAVFNIFPVFFTIFVSLHKWRLKKLGFVFLDNYRRAFGNLWYLFFLIGIVLLIVLAFRLLNRRRVFRLPTDTSSLSRIFGILLLGCGLVLLVFLLPQIYENGDADMLDSLRVTIWYSLGTVPIQLAFGLLLAVLLDQKFRGKQFFRVVFLLPYIVPSVAAAAVFERLFSLRSESFANQLLLAFGAEPLQWLREPTGIFYLFSGGTLDEAAGLFKTYWQTWAQGPSLALVSIMFFNYWVFVGYYALIYANGLSQIPQQLYDAAEVDGAGKATVFFRIIIPLLTPSTYFLTMLGIIGTFKAFNHIYVLRNPAARGAADPMSIYIFFTFFRKGRMDYATALSLILFAIVLGLTFVQRRLMEKRVHYGD